MGAPESGLQAAEQPSGEALLTALRTIKPAERARHAGVLDYWLSIRGGKEFPALHDLDPLQISDAGPSSILLELIGGGQDAAIRHLGDALKADVAVDRIIDAANPSILACIAKKLPIVAISRDFLAFEDSFDSGGGWTRLWVTLLPLSSCGSWVDYVYALVSVESGGGKAAKPVVDVAPVDEAVDPAEAVIEHAEAEELAPVAAQEAEIPLDEPVAETAEAVESAPENEPEPGPVAEIAPEPEPELEPEPEPAQDEVAEAVLDPEPEPEEIAPAVPESQAEPVEAVLESEPEPVELAAEPEPEAEPEAEAPAAKSGPGFSKLLEGFASLAGFYGQGVKVEDPVIQAELPATDWPEAEPEPEPVGEAVPEAAPEPEPAPEAEFVQPSEPAPAMEGKLQTMLAEVRAKADEANQARLRAVVALHEGLSAAYDFALDAESSPEEYLRLVEAQGLKIQLRAPMAPVARLAFEGACEPATIAQMEKVLAWALKEELPRGALLERIDQAGGIAELAAEVAG